LARWLRRAPLRFDDVRSKCGRKSGLDSEGLRQPLRLRNLDDNLARLGEGHLFARDLFDGSGIAFQVLDHLFECGVFLAQRLNFRFYFFDVALGALHCEKTVRAKNVVKQKD
jgi:hypothetical protein